MTLRETIYRILKDSDRLLTIKSILVLINRDNNTEDKRASLISKSDVIQIIIQYPDIFQNINGYIILSEKENWKNLLSSYWYLTNILRDQLLDGNTQFVISILLFCRRLADHTYHQDYDFNSQLLSENSQFIEQTISYDHLRLEGVIDQVSEKLLRGMLAECQTILSVLDKNVLLEISRILAHLDTSKFNDLEFGGIFSYFISLSDNGLKSGISFTPRGLREIMVHLLDPAPNKSIYDPCCGSGKLLIDALVYNRASGSAKGAEDNRRLAYYANMNTIMHALNNCEIEQKDIFEDPEKSLTYDYVISDLPLGSPGKSRNYRQIFKEWKLDASHYGRGFSPLILSILSKLNSDGKAVFTVSDGFLYSEGRDRAVRNLLIKLDIIESVVSIPPGTLRPYSNVKASIIVLNKNKDPKLKNQIKFISPEVLYSDKKSIELDVEGILELYKSENIYTKNSQLVDVRDLRGNSILSADSYDSQFFLSKLMLEEGSGKLLSDLVQVKAGIAPIKNDLFSNLELPLIKIENLSKDILETFLDSEIGEKVDRGFKYNKSAVQDPCLLVARIGDNLKPTIFFPTSSTSAILIHRGVYALIPNNENLEVDLEYLYYQMHSSFVQEQAKALRMGSVMPHISMNSMRQLVIPYMDLRSQKEFVSSQKANLIATERSRVAEKLKALGYQEEVIQKESDIVRTLVHQLRPTLLNIDLQVKSVSRIISQNGLGDLREVVNDDTSEMDPELADLISKPKTYHLSDIIAKLEADAGQLNDVLSTVNKVMTFKLQKDDFEVTDICDFIKRYANMKRIDIDGKYTVDVKGEPVLLKINKESFTELLDQLRRNAEMHAFLPNSHSKNRLSFSIRQNRERQVVIIEYNNNGKPYGLTLNDFVSAFQKGQSSAGSGIGGNFIYRIVKAHRGDLTLKEGLKTGFGLVFEFPFELNYKII